MPERNDLKHMEHLCQLWEQNELEWIHDKTKLKEFMERHIDDMQNEKEKAAF